MNQDRPLILIVDDETHILHVLSLRLTSAGYRVITAEDGQEGWAAALEHRPDMVITDLQMPFINGLELCQKLNEDERTRHVVVLMITARSSSLSGDCLRLTNLAGVITKPFSPREVLVRVEELVTPHADRKVG